MNTAPGYDNFSYLGIFCVGKVPSLLKFMQKMNPSKWYLWSMLSYLSIFFLSSLWTSGCLFAILCTDFCAFSLENCVIMHYCPKSFEGYVFFQNETYLHQMFHLSLSLSLLANEEGKVTHFVFYPIYFLVCPLLFCFWYPLLFTDTYCIFKQFKLIQLVLFHCLENILQFSPAIYTTWGIHIIDTGCDSCSYFLCV